MKKISLVSRVEVNFISKNCKKLIQKIYFDVKNKNFYKVFFSKTTLILIFGFSLGIISIWPGIILDKNRRCFFNFLKDGSDGNIELKTIFSVNPNYLLKIKSTNNNYMKILLVGDSCFRNF